MSDERERAIFIAGRVLDMPGRDPDRDEAVLARQFLRAIDDDLADGFRVWAGDCAKPLPDLTGDELNEAEGRIMGERLKLSPHAPFSVRVFYETAAKAFAGERARRAA